MALFKCPECGKVISDKAEKCPNCGMRMEEIWKKQVNKGELLKDITTPVIDEKEIDFEYKSDEQEKSNNKDISKQEIEGKVFDKSNNTDSKQTNSGVAGKSCNGNFVKNVLILTVCIIVIIFTAFRLREAHLRKEILTLTFS